MALAAYTVIANPGAYVSGIYYPKDSTLYLDVAAAQYPAFVGSIARVSPATINSPQVVSSNATIVLTVGGSPRTITLSELIAVLNQPEGGKTYVDDLFAALLAGSSPTRQTLRALSDLIDGLATQIAGHEEQDLRIISKADAAQGSADNANTNADAARRVADEEAARAVIAEQGLTILANTGISAAAAAQSAADAATSLFYTFTARTKLRALGDRLGAGYKLVGDNIVDDTAALNAVLAYGSVNGYKLSGDGLTYYTTADIVAPGTIDIEDVSIERNLLSNGNKIFKTAVGTNSHRIRGLKVKARSEGTTAVMSNSYGIWINGGAGHKLDYLESTGPGKISHIHILNTVDTDLLRPYVHDTTYNDAAITDDAAQGIYAFGNVNLRIMEPRVMRMLGNGAIRSPTQALPPGVSASDLRNAWTRGISGGANYKLLIRDPIIQLVDQAIDLSSSSENVDCTIEGGHLYDLLSHGVKFANYNRCCLAIGVVVERAGRVGFVNSAASSAASPSTYSPTGFSRLSVGNTFLACKAKDIGGRLDASGAQAIGYYAAAGTLVAGFSVESNPTVDVTYPRGTRILDCEADDSQTSKTMRYGFYNNVTYTRSSRLFNEFKNFRSSGHIVAATAGAHEQMCRVRGGASGTVSIASGTVGATPIGAVSLGYGLNDYDPCQMHSTTSNADNIYPEAGASYRVKGSVLWPASSAGSRQLDIYVGGTQQVGLSNRVAGLGVAHTQTIDAIVTIADQANPASVSMRATQDSGSALLVDKATILFSVERIFS